MKNKINVSEWVALFRDLGLTEAQMEKWHKLFEARHPAGHASFLEWLGLPQKEIEAIRSKSR